MTTPTEKHTWGNLVVIVVPALSDNFMYLIANDQTKVAAVVDPVEPAKLIEVAKRENFEIKKVLTTHNHWDHAGGNNQIAQLIPGIEIIGGVNDRAEGVTKEVDEGDKIDVGGLSVDVISTPCHTPGHVCYVVKTSSGPDVAFTGDTLFVAGCGKFNTGTPEMMHSNFQKLGNLPPNTLFFVGHEYTTANLEYAAYIEPDNTAIAEKLEWSRDRTSKGGFTVPTNVTDEHATNPFMRAVFGVPAVLKHCPNTSNPVEALKYVREEKSGNSWKQKSAKV